MWNGISVKAHPAGPLIGRHLNKFSDFAPPLEALGLEFVDLEEALLLRLLSACQHNLTTLDFYRV